MALTKVTNSMIVGAPANVLDSGAVGNGLTNDAAAVQAAVDGAVSQVEFPDGSYAIGTQISVNTTSPQNLTFIGSRTNSYITPTVNFSATASLNTLINNYAPNGKLSFKNIRFASDGTGGLPSGGFGGYYVSCDYQISPQKTIFSGEIDSCWYSPSSVTEGFLRGSLQNYSVRNSVWEGGRACFTLVGIYNYDIFFSNNVFYSGYYNFLDASQNASIVLNINVTANSATATGINAVASYVGMQVMATGIPIGTKIISVVPGVSFLMDRKSLVTNASLDARLDITTQLVTIDGLHSYQQEIDYLISAKGASRWNLSNINLQNTTTPAGGAIGLLEFENFAGVNVVNFQATQEQGGTLLDNAIALSGGEGRFSNGRITGATIGLYLSGLTRPVELTFSDVDFINCGYGLGIAAAATLGGKLVFEGCKFNNSTGYGIADLSGVHTLDADFYDCEFINAGMDGGGAGRNILASPTTGKVWRFIDCTIGQTTAAAAAVYYIDSAGAGGTLEFIRCKFVGTPPTARVSPGAESSCTFVYEAGYGGVVASVAAQVLPTSGDVFTISGTTSITSLGAAYNKGRTAKFIFQDVLTVTDGNNLKLAGNFATSADDCITLVCDGTNWYETGRSAN